MTESESIPEPRKSHSSKTNKSRPICIRLPNDLFDKLSKTPKTETIITALTQLWNTPTDSVSSNTQKLLDFLLVQFIDLGLKLKFGELKPILLENIERLKKAGVI